LCYINIFIARQVIGKLKSCWRS